MRRGRRPTTRTTLAGAAALALTALLAACSSDSDAGVPTTFAAPTYSTSTAQPKTLRAPTLRYQVFGSETTVTLLEYLQRHSYLIYDAIGEAGRPSGQISLALDRRGVGAGRFPIVGIDASSGLRLVVLIACDSSTSDPRTVKATLSVGGSPASSHAVRCGDGVGTTVFYLGPDQAPSGLRIAGPSGMRFAVTGIAVVV